MSAQVGPRHECTNLILGLLQIFLGQRLAATLLTALLVTGEAGTRVSIRVRRCHSSSQHIVLLGGKPDEGLVTVLGFSSFTCNGKNTTRATAPDTLIIDK